MGRPRFMLTRYIRSCIRILHNADSLEWWIFCCLHWFHRSPFPLLLHILRPCKRYSEKKNKWESTFKIIVWCMGISCWLCPLYWLLMIIIGWSWLTIWLQVSECCGCFIFSFFVSNCLRMLLFENILDIFFTF